MRLRFTGCMGCAQWAVLTVGGTPGAHANHLLCFVAGLAPSVRQTSCVNRRRHANDERDDELADEVVGAVVGLIPGIGGLLSPLAERASRAARAEHRRNRSKVMDAAERRSGMSREDLAEAIASQPELVPLATRIMFAAVVTGQARTLEVIGALFGEAASDQRPIDEVDLMLGSISDLHDVHFRFLQACSTTPPTTTNDDGEQVAGLWLQERLQEHLEVSRGVAVMGVAGLLRAGLIYSESVWAGDHYRPTEMGEAVLETLRAVATAQGEPPNR